MTESKLSDRYKDALIFAANLHGDQTRKGTQIAYLSHLLAVSGLVMENGGNEDEAIAGELRTPGDTRPFIDPDFMPHIQPIAPTMGWTFGHEFIGMSNQDLQDVLTDRKLVFIGGRASYQDIYGQSHSLKFRFRNVTKVFTVTGGQIVIEKWKYYPEEEGNDSD